MTLSVSDDARRLLDSIATTNPEWRGWLTLAELTLRAIDEPAWASTAVEADDHRAPDAPLLDRATLSVDARLAGRWVRQIFGAAGGTLAAIASDDNLDMLELLEAAVSQDDVRLVEHGSRHGGDPDALAAVAQLAAMPLLHACGRRLQGHIHEGWPHGYCPVCAAWPTMAELRGLEGERRLRCSRCGGDWSVGLRRCPYCLTTDYRQLQSLVPEEGGETRKVDACDNCKGYVKSVATLRPWPAQVVALEDLASVELDLVALDRGYSRPSEAAYPLRVRLVGAPARRRFLGGWRS